jgi:hypothetical protein
MDCCVAVNAMGPNMESMKTEIVLDLDKEIELDEEFLQIRASETKDNMFVIFTDSRYDKAWLTYMFARDSYSPKEYHAERMGKEAWIEFCTRIAEIDRKWAKIISDQIMIIFGLGK